jgi:hypothetical protein
MMKEMDPALIRNRFDMAVPSITSACYMSLPRGATMVRGVSVARHSFIIRGTSSAASRRSPPGSVRRPGNHTAGASRPSLRYSAFFQQYRELVRSQSSTTANKHAFETHRRRSVRFGDAYMRMMMAVSYPGALLQRVSPGSPTSPTQRRPLTSRFRARSGKGLLA